MEVSRYWRLQAQRYNLIGDICPHCAKKIVLKRAVCPYCAGEAKPIAKPEELATANYPLVIVAEATLVPVLVTTK